MTPSLFAGVEPIEVFVDLLSGLGGEVDASTFYHRICEAICRQTTMTRAAIFLQEGARADVRVAGCHGIAFEELARLPVSLAVTPIAQRALTEDRVIETADATVADAPGDFIRVLGITTLVCSPVSAAGKGYGVVCADRGGGRFELADGERHLLWTLGKVAALAATARIATREQERARALSERLSLAREVHERVMQRLFGVSLVLAASSPLDAQGRARAASEMEEALADLRAVLERPLARTTLTTLRAEITRACSAFPVDLSWEEGVEVPPELEAVTQSVLLEALRNVRKHSAASRVDLRVANSDGALVLEVRNDGRSGEGAPGAGMGLRLAGFEALQHGGFLEFGAVGEDGWRVRLVVPR